MKIKKYFPKRLFYRFILIIVLPVFIVQVVSTYVFYQTHLQNVIKRLSNATIQNIVFINKNYKDVDNIDNENLKVYFKKNQKLKSKDIIIGKFLGVTVSSIITGLLSLVLAIISLFISKDMFTIYEGVNTMYSLSSIIYAIVVIITYSFFISGLCIAIASTSKTFKEAQSALTPLTFISLFPGMIAFMIGITTTPLIAIIPFLNFTTIFTDITAGNINILHILLMVISTIIYISIVLYYIIKQYKSEKVLFAK